MKDKMPAPSVSGYYRMDFEHEVTRADEARRELIVKIIPDPRRYESVIKDEKTWYRDKYLYHLVSMDDFAKAMTMELPIYYLNASIESAPQYAIARQKALAVR